MAQILGNWRVLAAMAFSAVLILGAYGLAQGFESPNLAQASTETALLQAIAALDSDNDGLPDWEEALYGTDPQNPDSRGLGMTDGEAVAKGLIVPKAIADVPQTPAAPVSSSGVDYAAAGIASPTEGTLTDAFAKNFFALYIAAKDANGGAGLTSDQTNALVTQAMSQLFQNLAPAPDFKTAAQIKVSGTGPDALRAYAASAEKIFAAYNPNVSENQLQYLQDYLNNGDQGALTSLRKLATSFQNTALGLATLSVPSEVAATHLALVNALARVAGQISDFSRVDSDPLAAMFALDQHPQTVVTLANAFSSLANEYSMEGVVLPAGTPGASFVNVMQTLNARSSASTP